MAVLIDGKVISTKIKEELKQEVTEMKAQGITPCLAVILVGDDSASAIYVRNKKRACEYVGIESRSYELPEDTTQEELEKLVTSLNEDENVDGILVQLPLPGQIDEEKITTMISPKKDVDGFLADSIGALCLGTEGFRSCTPAGVIELIRRSGYSIEGKECVIVGRSNHVGNRKLIGTFNRLIKVPSSPGKFILIFTVKQTEIIHQFELPFGTDI